MHIETLNFYILNSIPTSSLSRKLNVQTNILPDISRQKVLRPTKICGYKNKVETLRHSGEQNGCGGRVQ